MLFYRDDTGGFFNVPDIIIVMIAVVTGVVILVAAICLLLTYVSHLHPQRMILLADFLADLARRGSSLPEGLDAFGEDVPGRLRDRLRRVVRQIREGESLGQAMAQVRGPFSPRFAAVVHIGETTGTLPQMMDAYALQDLACWTAYQKVVVLCLYPLITSLLLLACTGLMSMTDCPLEMQWTLADSGYEPHVMGRTVPEFASLCLSASALVLLGVLAGTLLALLWQVLNAFVLMRTQPSGRLAFLNPIRRVLARTCQLRSLATFCDTLAILLDAGVPTAEAVSQAAVAGSFGMPDTRMQRLASLVRDGENLSDCMIRELGFRKSEAWILHATGGTVEFPAGLRDIAQICREHSDRRLALFRNCLLPVLILFEAVAVVLAAAAVFLPLARVPLDL